MKTSICWRLRGRHERVTQTLKDDIQKRADEYVYDKIYGSQLCPVYRRYMRWRYRLQIDWKFFSFDSPPLTLLSLDNAPAERRDEDLVLLETTFINTTGDDIDHSFSAERETRATNSWTVESGVSSDGKVEATLGAGPATLAASWGETLHATRTVGRGSEHTMKWAITSSVKMVEGAETRATLAVRPSVVSEVFALEMTITNKRPDGLVSVRRVHRKTGDDRFEHLIDFGDLIGGIRGVEQLTNNISEATFRTIVKYKSHTSRQMVVFEPVPREERSSHGVTDDGPVRAPTSLANGN